MVDVVVKDDGESVAVNPENVAAMFEATGDLTGWASGDGDRNAYLLDIDVDLMDALPGDVMRFNVTPTAAVDRLFLRIRKLLKQ